MTTLRFSAWNKYLVGALGWFLSLLAVYIGVLFIRAGFRGVIGGAGLDVAYFVGGIVILGAGILLGWQNVRVFRCTGVEIETEDGNFRFKTSFRMPSATEPWDSVRAVTVGRFSFVPQGWKAIVITIVENTPARWHKLYIFWLPFLAGQRRAAKALTQLFLEKGVPIRWKGVLPFERTRLSG